MTSTPRTKTQRTVIGFAAALAILGASLIGPASATAAASATTATISGTLRGTGTDIAKGSGWVRISEVGTSADTVSYSVSTRRNGAYKISGIKPGTYTMWSSGFAEGGGESESGIWFDYSGEYWDDQIEQSLATQFTLVAGQVVKGMDVDFDTVGGVYARPSIEGALTVGRTVTAKPGVWESGTVLRYEWRVGGALQGGKTGPTLKLTPPMLGKSILVAVYGEPSGDVGSWYTERNSGVQGPITSGGTAAFKKAGTATISGAPKVGAKLTAVSGGWSPAATAFSYKWYVNGVAVGENSKYYTPVFADKGKTVRVKVTAHRAGYTTRSVSSKSTSVIGTGTLTTAIPTINGAARVNVTLTAAPGKWGPQPVTQKVQWYRNGVAITGATAFSYRTTAADYKKPLTVKVTGSAPGFATASKTSKARVIAAGVLTAPTPKIGSSVVGKKATVTVGTWGPGTVTKKYQWYVNGVAVTNATAPTYTIPSSAFGKKLTVKVTGSKTAFTTVSKTSPAVVVTRGSVTAGSISIQGTTGIGSMLSAVTAGWSAGTKFTYQWFNDDGYIHGATSATHKITTLDAGTWLGVRVTGSKPGYLSVTKTAESQWIDYPFNISEVTVTGTLAVGETVSATFNGDLPDGTTVEYTWNRQWNPLGAPSSPTYVLTDQDAGNWISVDATVTVPGYRAIWLQSQGAAFTVPADENGNYDVHVFDTPQFWDEGDVYYHPTMSLIALKGGETVTFIGDKPYFTGDSAAALVWWPGGHAAVAGTAVSADGYRLTVTAPSQAVLDELHADHAGLYLDVTIGDIDGTAQKVSVYTYH